ncbi:MAG: YkgJ family cysteine cluster protein [bacterium]
MGKNPCLECGACCAIYRASFYWAEADDETPGGVPVELTEDVSQFFRAMKGTNAKKPHCVALEGIVGENVRCSIYEKRPSPCREVKPSYIGGPQNEKCDFARFAYNLERLKPKAPSD